MIDNHGQAVRGRHEQLISARLVPLPDALVHTQGLPLSVATLRSRCGRGRGELVGSIS